MESDPAPAAPWPDSRVAKEVLRRQNLRAAGNFSEADKIVVQLLSQNVILDDTAKDVPSVADTQNVQCTRWFRVPSTFDTKGHSKCMYWRHNDKTFCSVERAPNKFYCERHSSLNVCKDHVPCPLDRRHGILPARAAHHVLRCQSKPGRLGLKDDKSGASDAECAARTSTSSVATKQQSPSPSFVVQGINRPESACDNAAADSRDLSAIAQLARSFEFLRALEVKVDRALDDLELVKKVRLDCSLLKKQSKKRKHKCVTRTCDSGSSEPHRPPNDKGTSATSAPHDRARSSSAAIVVTRRKNVKRGVHQFQHAAIVGFLQQQLPSFGCHDVVALECCAGTGQLAQELQGRFFDATLGRENVTKCPPRFSVVLIDRSNFRGKADAAMKERADAHTRARAAGKPDEHALLRVRADLADVDFSRVPPVARAFDSGGDVIFFGKHLCGAASDLTLSAAISTALRCRALQHARTAVYVCVALCCHHLCEWDSLLPLARGTLACCVQLT